MTEMHDQGLQSVPRHQGPPTTGQSPPGGQEQHEESWQTTHRPSLPGWSLEARFREQPHCLGKKKAQTEEKTREYQRVSPKGAQRGSSVNRDSYGLLRGHVVGGCGFQERVRLPHGSQGHIICAKSPQEGGRNLNK